MGLMNRDLRQFGFEFENMERFTRSFLISNSFISNTRLKLAKNQGKAKQHPQAETLLFENYLLFSSTLSSKNNGAYSKISAN